MEGEFVEKALVFAQKANRLESTSRTQFNDVSNWKFADIAKPLRRASQMKLRHPNVASERFGF